MQLYRRASVRPSLFQLIFRCTLFCETLKVALGGFKWPLPMDNQFPMEEESVCSQLPSISQIFRLGDFLLLKPSASERYASSFLLINWQKGDLYGKPVSREQLFGFDHNGYDPDGQLLFASTFNLCQLWSSSRQRMKRDSRQMSDTEDVERDDSEDADALAVNKLESKLSDIQEEINQLREKTTIKEEHSQIKQQLASLNGQLQILLGSLLSKSTTASPTTTEKMTTSSKTEKMDRTQSTATTSVPIVSIHDELHEQMRQLFFNLSQIAVDVNVKLAQLKASENVNIAMTASTPKMFTTTAGTISVISTSTLATSQGTKRLTKPAEPRNCPNVILATFAHSQQSWESLLCNNEMYGTNSWLKSSFFNYQSDANGPNLLALSMDRELLQYRGVIQVGRRFTSVHPELSCSLKEGLLGSDDIFGGFTIEDRVFVQNKYGRIWEKSQVDNSTKMSINQFLRDVCHGNSSVSRKPLKLIGEALWLPEKPEKTNSWKHPSSERLIGRRKKMKGRMMYTKRIRLFAVSKTEEETFNITEGSDIPESKWNRNNDNVNDEWQGKQATTSAAIIRNTTLNVLTAHQASLMNASVSMKTNNSRLQGQFDKDDEYSNALSQAKDRSIEDEDQEKVDKPKGGRNERNTTQEWSFKSIGLVGLTVVIILGLGIAGFLFFARSRKTIPEEASEEDENEDEGRNKKKKKKRKVSKDANDKKQRKHKNQQSDDGESMDVLKKESKVEEKERRKHKRTKKLPPNEHQEKKTHLDSSYQMNQMPAILQQVRTTAEPKGTETEPTAATRGLSVETPKVTVQQVSAAEEQPPSNQTALGLMPSQDDIDLHEVVLIDPENVLQFCGQDTQMANRIEMMFGESKVIAQLMDMKRRDTPKKTAPGGRKSTATQTCISKDDDLKQEGGKAESAIVKIAIKKSLGQGAALPKAKERPESPLGDPKVVYTSTSPKSLLSKPTLLYKPNDENIRPFIEVLHRMKKTLKKRSKRRQVRQR